MLDPDINIKEKFDQIVLPCNSVDRINNSINAPVRPHGESGKKRGPRGPMTSKTYDTDTDNQASASEHEDSRQHGNNTSSKHPNQILAQNTGLKEESKSLQQV